VISSPNPDHQPIRRAAYGVPHIGADNFRGIGIGLGYAQAED
jgi:acyl-homoserine-lactone acylase